MDGPATKYQDGEDNTAIEPPEEYQKKQKVEIHIIFLLITFAIDVFLFFVLRKEDAALSEGWRFSTQRLLIPQTLLYLLVGISGARIWLEPESLIRRYILWAWVTQIGLNIIWPITFFYIPVPIITPVLFTLLFITLVTQMFYTFFLDQIAGYLLIPYFLIVAFKMVFHWILYILNITTVG